MARLNDRLTALERVKKGGVIGMPLIMIIPDDGLTDEQQYQIDEAEAIGQNVIMVMRDTHDPSLHSP